MLGRVVVLVFLLLVASCAHPADPAGPPAQDNRFGAPLPDAPRDVRPLSTDPCAVLGARQWKDMGFDPRGEMVILPTGERSCEWRGPSRLPYANIGIADQRDILVDTYRVRQFSVFRPTAINGLPATIEQTSPGSISCNVTVGTAQGQGFLVIYDAPLGPDGQADDPCGQGQRIAEQIVARLPPLPAQ